MNKNTRITNKIKAEMFKMSNQGVSIKDIAVVFNIHRMTAARHIRNYKGDEICE